MPDALVEILDRLDAALARAIGVVPDGSLDSAAHAARRARNRLRFPDDLAIVALAGGTGTGKSALFNSVLGQESAVVGGLRPTTSVPMVSIPRAAGERMDAYLAEFGEMRRAQHDEPEWLVLIDLPDTDSVEVDHRMKVESLLPRVDLVVWVADVEKYRDASLHRDFLVNLVGYESQFLFVLNQVDRIPAAELSSLIDDFEQALRVDGFESPSVVSVAAAPPIGPQRIEQLREALAERARDSMSGKVTADLRSALAAITKQVGGGASGFDEAWPAVLQSAVDRAVAGEALDAARDLSGYFSDLSERLTGKAAEVAMGIAAHIGEDLGEATEAAETPPAADGPRWRFWEEADPAEVDAEQLRSALDLRVNERLRPILRERAEAIAELVSISVDLANLG